MGRLSRERVRWWGWERNITRKGAGALRASQVIPAAAPPSTKFVVNPLSWSSLRRTPGALARFPSARFPFLPERVLKREIS